MDVAKLTFSDLPKLRERLSEEGAWLDSYCVMQEARAPTRSSGWAPGSPFNVPLRHLGVNKMFPPKKFSTQVPLMLTRVLVGRT